LQGESGREAGGSVCSKYVYMLAARRHGRAADDVAGQGKAGLASTWAWLSHQRSGVSGARMGNQRTLSVRLSVCLPCRRTLEDGRQYVLSRMGGRLQKRRLTARGEMLGPSRRGKAHYLLGSVQPEVSCKARTWTRLTIYPTPLLAPCSRAQSTSNHHHAPLSSHVPCILTMPVTHSLSCWAPERDHPRPAAESGHSRCWSAS